MILHLIIVQLLLNFTLFLPNTINRSKILDHYSKMTQPLATKFREQQENIDLSPDKFYVTLFSTQTAKNKDNVSTNFTNTLYKPLLLKGDYEVALSSISFSKVGEIDLGEITINCQHNESNYIEKVRISAIMGQDYKSVFTKINQQISDVIQKREYQRRLYLRKIHQVPSNINILKTEKNFISLPLKDNKIYDTIVYNEISEITPQLEYKEGFLSFKTSDSFYLSFSGNLTKIVTGIRNEKYDKNSIPIAIPSKSLPDFNSCIVTCDIIELEHCQEFALPILKCISLNLNEKIQERAICKNFESLIYQHVNKDVNNVVRTISTINIKIKTNLNQILSFDQGEVLVRLHFKKQNE
jgi:hypothetical protein